MFVGGKCESYIKNVQINKYAYIFLSSCKTFKADGDKWGGTKGGHVIFLLPGY